MSDGTHTRWEKGTRKKEETKEERWICTHAVCLGSRDNAANSPVCQGLKRPLFLPIFRLALTTCVINTRVAFSLFLPAFLPIPLFSVFFLSLSSLFRSFTLLFTFVVPRLAWTLPATAHRAKLIRPTDSFTSNTNVRICVILTRLTNVFSLKETFEILWQS